MKTKKIFFIGFEKEPERFFTLYKNGSILEEKYSNLNSNWNTKVFRTKKQAESALRKLDRPTKNDLFVIEKQSIYDKNGEILETKYIEH